MHTPTPKHIKNTPKTLPIPPNIPNNPNSLKNSIFRFFLATDPFQYIVRDIYYPQCKRKLAHSFVFSFDLSIIGKPAIFGVILDLKISKKKTPSSIPFWSKKGGSLNSDFDVFSNKAVAGFYDHNVETFSTEMVSYCFGHFVSVKFMSISGKAS